MKVGFYQFNPLFGEVKQNLETVAGRLATVTCDLMVLPELFSSGYQFTSAAEVQALAEPVPQGPTTQRLLEVARDRRMVLVAGLAESDQGRFYNSAVVVGPDGFLGCYRKVHLFYEETLFFTPGERGFQVWDIGLAKIGVMVCFDWFYPEAARTLALQGADLLCHPSNLVLPYCPEAMVTRCIENRVFGITANRIGYEERGHKPRLTFIGNSEIVTPRGRILYRAGADDEEIHIVDIDPTEARNKNLNTYNHLFNDRRPEHYGL